MGWFWADPIAPPRSVSRPDGSVRSRPQPPASSTPDTAPSRCPVRHSDSSACPYKPGESAATTPSTTQRGSRASTIAALNPLNYMPSDLSQHRESPAQTVALSIERETSSIPRGGSSDADSRDTATGATGPQERNWVYPSPQQMYNALLRKGYADTPQDAVPSMVAVHNFLNEGAWAEIVEWERRFGRGLAHGWRASAAGEEGSVTGAMIAPTSTDSQLQPRLLRFMGRADAQTPKASIMQALGWVYPAGFATAPPFDRHDWYVERRGDGGDTREVRYVIDYYAGPPEPTGEPVFYLDIRPALDRPGAAAERLIRWGRDVWWRGSGGRARLGLESRV